MNITVVGAAGRLGQQVAEEASRRSHRVTGLARHPQRMAKPELLSRIAVGDGRDRDIVSGAVVECPGRGACRHGSGFQAHPAEARVRATASR